MPTAPSESKAVKEINSRMNDLARIVLGYVTRSGKRGATCYEVGHQMGIHPATSIRCLEILKQEGKITSLGINRRLGHKISNVWISK